VHEKEETVSFDESFVEVEEDFYFSNDGVVRGRSRIRWSGDGCWVYREEQLQASPTGTQNACIG
jgi:hypothetical protein